MRPHATTFSSASTASKGTAVCHGDFNPSNVIVSEDGTLSVCDWAHATQGAPAADVAMTYLLFSLTSKEQAEAYLDTYCERADMAKQIVRSVAARHRRLRARAQAQG